MGKRREGTQNNNNNYKYYYKHSEKKNEDFKNTFGHLLKVGGYIVGENRIKWNYNIVETSKDD